MGLTYFPTSQNALPAMIEDQVSAVGDESKAAEPAGVIVRYEPDWADTVLDRSVDWKADNCGVPLWVIKATENSDFALFQLPAPDHRWVVKFAGKILEPFNYRLSGWADLHELMVHGYLLDRTELITGQTALADLRKRKGDLLRNTELIHGEYGPDNQKIDSIHCSVTGTRLRGPDIETGDGKTEPDRWKTCADDFNKQVRDRLDRVFSAIKRKDKLAASVIKQAVHLINGQWSYSDSANWMTALGEIPYDATMVLTGKNWEINFPDSVEPLIVPDSVGIRAIARVLMCNNIVCPCALLADGPLLNEFLGRPRHHKYFEAIYRRPAVECGDPANGEVERAICTSMRFKPGWYYRADHVISESSELHTVCGLPTGKVTLRRAEALEGVRDLIKKQRAKLFFCSEPSQHFKHILSDIEAGIEFARKQEKLLEQVQPKSEEYKTKIQKAVYRITTELEQMGDWTTRYDRLADHFSQHIRGGTVFQYTGLYRWKIEGLAQTPDTWDLAADHVQFKHSKLAKAKRKTKAKLHAMSSLNQLSRLANLANLQREGAKAATAGRGPGS